MYLYGAGGHAKVIIEILESMGLTVDGLLDSNPAIHSLLGYKVNHYTPSVNQHLDGSVIVAIGNNRTRKELVEKLKNSSFEKAIHPKTSISTRSEIGVGTVVVSGASINSNVSIGKHVIINTNASIGHDCIIHDFAHISSNATLCGGVRIGEGTHVGAGAIIIPGIKVGEWVTIGAGTVVIDDVPDGVKIVGNPAHIILPNAN